MTKTFFEMSKQEHLNSGMSVETWEETSRTLWAAIKTGPHYHDGRECQYVTTCPNYVPPRTGK
jgi:hypothetical protein